jgi:hypothetical protein
VVLRRFFAGGPSASISHATRRETCICGPAGELCCGCHLQVWHGKLCPGRRSVGARFARAHVGYMCQHPPQ